VSPAKKGPGKPITDNSRVPIPGFRLANSAALMKPRKYSSHKVSICDIPRTAFALKKNCVNGSSAKRCCVDRGGAYTIASGLATPIHHGSWYFALLDKRATRFLYEWHL
jgi:hypothetical protein